MIRKLAFWAVVIFAIYYLVNDPHGAAHAVRAAFAGLHSVGASLSTFANGL